MTNAGCDLALDDAGHRPAAPASPWTAPLDRVIDAGPAHGRWRSCADPCAPCAGGRACAPGLAGTVERDRGQGPRNGRAPRGFRHLLAHWSPSPAIRGSLWLHAAALGALAADPLRWREVAGLIAANHALLACGMWPRSAMLGPNLARLPARAAGGAHVVALTFDDGPDPDVTPRILDLLDRQDAKASFFVIGRMAMRHPHILREIAARGHSVENHTHRHPPSFACWSPGAMLREITDAQAAIADACGQEPAFFRAPAGIRSPLLDPVLAMTGLRLVSWTRRGYDALSSRPDLVYARLTRDLAGGDILVLHDGRGGAVPRRMAPALTVLPRLLARLREDDLTSVSLRMALSEEPAGAAEALGIAPACRAPAGYASR